MNKRESNKLIDVILNIQRTFYMKASIGTQHFINKIACQCYDAFQVEPFKELKTTFIIVTFDKTNKELGCCNNSQCLYY